MTILKPLALQVTISMVCNDSAQETNTSTAAAECSSPTTPEQDQDAVIGSALVDSPLFQSTSTSRQMFEEAVDGQSFNTAASLESPLPSAALSPEAPSSEEAASTSPQCDEKVGPDSFELLRVVGQGAFGKVRQVTFALQIGVLRHVEHSRLTSTFHKVCLTTYAGLSPRLPACLSLL